MSCKAACQPSYENRYDLLEVIMICLGKKARKTKNRIIKLLDTVLSNDISVETKKQVLQADFGIEPTEKLVEEMRVMCNLSDNIEEEAIERGIEQGIERGKLMARAEMVDEYIQQAGLTKVELEEVCRKFHISSEDYYRVTAGE